MKESAVLGRFASLGDGVLLRLETFGDFAQLAWATLRSVRRRRFPWREVLVQLEAVGAQSTAIVVVTALSTGMVLALQTAYALGRFGAKPYVGSIVGLALVRELGPVLAALMVAGRVGAGIASELGSMQVTEQVDAIRAMGSDPVQKLVLPRVVATTLAVPVLTIFAIVVGVLGGMLVADLQFHVTARFFLQTITTTVRVSDLFAGVAKTFAFGWTIAMVACWVGLGASGGTAGVGRATTRAVVISAIAVLVSDFFLTKLLMALPDQFWSFVLPGGWR